jgi:hypothetical protein
MCADYRPYGPRFGAHTPWSPAAYADWFPSTGVVFRNNHIHDVGGDGVIVRVAHGTVVEGNLAHDLWMRADGNSAGLWAINADATLFRYNEVFGVRLQHGIEPGDGMAFDADMGAVGTRFLANYSHDNAGGLALFCGCNSNEGGRPAEALGTVVEDNFSLNDGRRAVVAAGASASVVRNNVVVAKGVPAFENVKGASGSQVRFEGNTFVNLGQAIEVIRRKNPAAAFDEVAWSGNRFIGAWKTDPTLPADIRFEALGTTNAKALFEAWARRSGFAEGRYSTARVEAAALGEGGN